jgi:hypothetical protein
VQAFDGTLPLLLLADGVERLRFDLVAEHPPAEQEHRGARLDGALRGRRCGSGPENKDISVVSGREAALVPLAQWVLCERELEQQPRI